jgi:hypothetical protein
MSPGWRYCAGRRLPGAGERLHGREGATAAGAAALHAPERRTEG